jgi:OOP family OmpA-OmpF porin
MKRLLLLPALLLASASFAETPKYEISPMIGYNLAEGNIGLDDNGHALGSIEFQYNYPDTNFGAEFSVLYSPDVDYEGAGEGDTSITRTLINGVYTFEKNNKITPFVKAGAGYEFVSRDLPTNGQPGNQDGFVLDAGVGVKYAMTKNWALKAEAIYLAKVDNRHNAYSDNNLITLVGLNYSFGYEPKPQAKEVVEEVVVVAAVIEKDSDADGVYDSLDKCPDTPAGTRVNAQGCPVVLDDDQDGVVNEKDLCPNTPMGEKVDTNGCPLVVNLEINFANDSAEIPAEANVLLDKYAAFLKRNTNYSAKIVGYTDSRGSEAYNQKLSQRRAKAVMDALIQRGVDPKQLSAIGMGELNPVASNDTPEGRAKNRRIEAEMTLN